jgi:hypothetical protein
MRTLSFVAIHFSSESGRAAIHVGKKGQTASGDGHGRRDKSIMASRRRVGITRGRNYLYLIFVGMETVLFGNMLTEYRFLDSRTHSWPACFQRVPDAAAARASFVVAANCVCRLGSGTLQTCVALTPSFRRELTTTTRRRLSKMLVVRRLKFRCWWTLKQPISSTRI